MRYSRLGKTGLSVSVIGVGTWQFSGLWGKDIDQNEADAILSRAGELGINFLDTAECYGPDHLSERLIGNAIAGERDRWVVATKFGHNNANDLGERNYLPDQVLVQLEDSLRALRTDYIDVYQLHSAPDKWFDNDALWTMLDKQVQAGKVRFLGNSIGRPNMHEQLTKSSQYGISVIQTVYNALKPRSAKLLFPLAEEQDLGIIARAPLAMGLLSGKYKAGHVFEDVRAMFMPSENLDENIQKAHDALASKPADMESATWANAWCLQDPRVSVVIPGIKSVAQVETNALAGDVRL